MAAGGDCFFDSTLRLKSLWPHGSVWGKTTLNTGSVGGAGADLQLEKLGHLFLCPWHFVYQFTAISNKMEFREELSKKYFQFLLQ